MNDIDKKLQNYLKLWSLSEPKLLATTPTSFIYEVSSGEDFILKILTPIGLQDEKESAAVLTAWQGRGAVSLKAFDQGALLIERLEGPNLYAFSASDQEEQATQILCGIIRKIHANPIPQRHTIPLLGVLFEPLMNFQQIPSDKKKLFKKAVEMGRHLLQTQSEVVLLHGDLHHENVMKRKTGEYVCFDPKGFIGDPSYEIATILKNPWDYPAISEREDLCLARAQSFAEALQLPLDRILGFAFVHMCLSAMWALQDGGDPSHQLKIASFLESHVS